MSIKHGSTLLHYRLVDSDGNRIMVQLLEANFSGISGVRPQFDVSPDGKKFLIFQAASEESTPQQVDLILNFQPPH